MVILFVLLILLIFILLTLGGDEFVGVSQGDNFSFCEKRKCSQLIEYFSYYGFVGIDD